MQANHLRPAPRRLANLLRRPRQIFFLIRGAAHLHKSHRKFVASCSQSYHETFFSSSSRIFQNCHPDGEPAKFAGSERRDRGKMLVFQNHSLQQSPSSLRLPVAQPFLAVLLVFLLRLLSVFHLAPSVLKSFLSLPLLDFSSPLLVHYTYNFIRTTTSHFIQVLSGESKAKSQKNCHRARSSRPRERQTPPIFPLDLSKLKTIDDLVRAMGNTAYTARQVGDAPNVLEAMAATRLFRRHDSLRCSHVGQNGTRLCDLIESGIVKAVVSTGALMAHASSKPRPLHFRYDPSKNERQRTLLAGYNRVYDSPSRKNQFSDHVEEVVDAFSKLGSQGSRLQLETHRRIGEYLTKHTRAAAFSVPPTMQRPCLRPAFSIRARLDFALINTAPARQAPAPRFDPSKTSRICRHHDGHKKNGHLHHRAAESLAIGRAIRVYAELMARRGYKQLPLKRYSYGVRICPEPVHWGGLSAAPTPKP